MISVRAAVSAASPPTGSSPATVQPQAAQQDVRTYGGIAGRNAFALRDPAPVVQQQQTNAVDVRLPKVSLGGITTILGTKQALLTVVPPEAKTMEEVKLPILAEGQKEGVVEVKKIDEQAGTVDIVNSGKPMTITFEEAPPTLLGATNAITAGTGYQLAAGVNPGGGIVGLAPTNVPGSLASSRTQGSAAAMPQFRGRGYTAGGTNGVVPPLPGATQTVVPAPAVVPSTTELPVPSGQALTTEERAVLQEVESQMRSQQPSADVVMPPPAGGAQQYLYQQPAGVIPGAPNRNPTQPPYPIIPQ